MRTIPLTATLTRPTAYAAAAPVRTTRGAEYAAFENHHARLSRAAEPAAAMTLRAAALHDNRRCGRPWPRISPAPATPCRKACARNSSTWRSFRCCKAAPPCATRCPVGPHRHQPHGHARPLWRGNTGMSGLVLKLGPRERVLINGAVIENGDRRARLSIVTPMQAS